MSSILLPTKSVNDRDSLVEFLGQEFRPWDAIYEHPKGKDHSAPLIEPKGRGLRACFTEEDSYGYTFALMRWCALRVGKKEVSPRLSRFGIDKAVPSYLYSPQDSFPILLVPKGSPHITDKRVRFWVVNPLGIPWEFMGKGTERFGRRKAIKAELSRLFKAWKEKNS